MSPKVALRQPEPLAKAAEAAIRDEKNSLIANSVLRAVKYRDIPKDKRYRILRTKKIYEMSVENVEEDEISIY